MSKQWFVLAHADKGSDLLRCTQEGFDVIELRPEAMNTFGTQLQNEVPAQVAEDGGRYAPEGATRQATGDTPRATFTNNDVRTRGADTEQHLTRIAQAVRQEMAGTDAPLLVAMDEARFSLFQAVSGLERLPKRLDASPRSASAEQLWKLSSDRIA